MLNHSFEKICFVNELFETLKKHQPHLNDKKANEMAYELVKSL